MNQYYQMSLDEAIDLSQKGFISNYGLLLFYIKITFKKGWRIRLVEEKVRHLLSLSKTQYRRALKAIAENFPEFSFEKYSCHILRDEEKIEMTVSDREMTVSDREMTVSDREMTVSDREMTVSDRENAQTNNKNNTSDDRANCIHSSFHSFFSSLSQEERDDFLSFVRGKTADFSVPINDVTAWLAGKNQAGEYRWQVYYAMFQDKDKKPDFSLEDWIKHAQKLKDYGYIRNWRRKGNDIEIAEEDCGRISWHDREVFFKHNPGYATNFIKD